MDDNTSIQFRLRLARINGIKMNEEQIDEADHHILARVSKDDGKMTQKSVIVTTKNRDAAMVRAERHFRDKGMKVHALKYVRQSDSAPYLPGSSNVREENQMNEEQIDEVKMFRSSDNDVHNGRKALELYHRTVGGGLRSGETYPRAHQMGVAMVKHDYGQFGSDHLENHFKEMKKHAKNLSAD